MDANLGPFFLKFRSGNVAVFLCGKRIMKLRLTGTPANTGVRGLLIGQGDTTTFVSSVRSYAEARSADVAVQHVVD